MLQSILSLMLAAVQVLAWNAAPVYLCLEADGSACVDRGPVFCDCCHVGGQPRAGHSCGDADCAEHGHDNLATGEQALSESPCGCEHEQISDAQVAVKGRDRSNLDLAPQAPAVVAVLCKVESVSQPGELLATAHHESSSSRALAARAGVVLRL